MTSWPKPTQSSSLREAIGWYRSRVKRELPTTCPCCRKKADGYAKNLHGNMILCLFVAIEHIGPNKTFRSAPFFDRFGIASSQQEWAKCCVWGLTRKTERRGWWQVTDNGVAFINEDLLVPKTAVWFKNRFMRLEGELIGLRQIEAYGLMVKKLKKLGIVVR